jgi:hypothetical protein
VNKLVEPSDNRVTRQEYLRQAIDATIRSLGGPISKTITWHLNNKGIMSDSKGLDVKSFYLHLQELVGPGADMIMEETWDRLSHQLKESRQFNDGPIIDRISRLMKTGVEA